MTNERRDILFQRIICIKDIRRLSLMAVIMRINDALVLAFERERARARLNSDEICGRTRTRYIQRKHKG